MVAKIKNSFLKNSFHLLCYRNYVKENSKYSLDDDLKRLSNSFPNLYNSDAVEKQPEPRQETKNRSHSANGRYDDLESQKPVKNHQSLKTLKQLKKKNEANNSSDKSRSKSSQPNLTNDLGKSKSKMAESRQPSINLTKGKSSGLSSLRLSKKLQGLKRQSKPCTDINSSNANSSIFTTNSILQNPRKRNDTSVGEKKAVRFADSLGLELENVITLNNQLDNQMKYMRLSKVSHMYPQLMATERPFVQNLPLANINFSQKNEFMRNDANNYVNANVHLIDFGEGKTDNQFLSRPSHVKVINYAEPRIYSNASNYCQVYDDVTNYVPSNFVDVNNPINLYYSFNNDSNMQKISITTRLNNGKLESEKAHRFTDTQFVAKHIMISESEAKEQRQADLAPGLKSDMNQSLDNLKEKKVRYRARNRHGMTKSYNFNINLALDYTCHRFNGDNNCINFCGKCNSCQIVNQLNNLKQWFDRASHVTLKAFLIGLIVRINNIKIYKYLNDLLRPLTESKDFIYARNKFLPSCDEDHMKATNNRCLDNEYVNKQINATWNWYSNSTNYIKLNFMLSLLNKCDQALVFMMILKLKSILETHNPYSESAQSSYESDSEMIFDAYDDEEDYEEDIEVKNILKKDIEQPISDLKHVDFIRLLPVHLSKSILSSLSKKNLYNCLFVCKYWCNLIKEVHKEGFLNKILADDMMLLKGTSSKGINPRYANNVDVKVPNLIPGTCELIRIPDQKVFRTTYKSEWNWSTAFQGYETRNVIMEERNVFCGPYNVLLLKEKKDPHRVSHFNGQNLVAFGSFDKKIRFIDLKLASEKSTTIQGHAGSIKCIYICEIKKIVVTGSYDTSIRVWSIENGKCLRIFQGHQQTVNCISMDDERDRVISGSGDKTCRVWNLSKKKCWRTFKHMYQINSVAIGEEICISGGSSGKIKVFNLQSGKLIKTISAHMGPVNNIKFDKWHILTCSSDGYALVYSTQGKHKNCLAAMRHPKEVLCMEFQYLRAITGSADGKIRIWSILTGDCLRVMRGNSQCDPILSMSIVDNRILLNTEFNLIMMEFEIVQFDYESSMTNIADNHEEMVAEELKRSTSSLKKIRNYSQIRASRSELVATPNAKLFNDDRKTVLDHSARPISAKNLREANLVHKITSKPLNITRNSIGNISDFGLKKRESFVQNINYAITSQTTLSGISNRTTAMSHLHPSQMIFKDPKIEEARLNFQRELELFKSRTTDLDETKQFLREQLKEMKQIEQSTPSNNTSPELQREKNLFDTKSCVDARVLDHIDPQIKNYTDNSVNRPTSSPSRVDTKTKIRLKQEDLKSIKNFELEEKFDILFNESEPKINRKQKSQKIVSKIFETREQNSATLRMHPINIKSKIPNPRIVSPVKLEQKKQPIRKESINRSKSAFFNENRKEFVPIFYRPKSNLLNPPPKPLGGIIEVNKFIAGDQLNLMTNKQVDKIIDTLNTSKLIPKKSKEAIREDFYKQLWTLKSKGIYHGSLLAKPKSIAPEIRE